MATVRLPAVVTAREESLRRQGISTEKAAQQLGSDPAVGEHRGRRGSRRQMAA
jgi:hypothetical protein